MGNSLSEVVVFRLRLPGQRETSDLLTNGVPCSADANDDFSVSVFGNIRENDESPQRPPFITGFYPLVI